MSLVNPHQGRERTNREQTLSLSKSLLFDFFVLFLQISVEAFGHCYKSSAEVYVLTNNTAVRLWSEKIS